MAICRQCGSPINDGDAFCPKCGAIQENQSLSYTQYQSQPPAQEDNGGCLWSLLGCCIPIVGLVLFLVWKDSKPKTAKAAGMGALASVIIMIIYYVLIVVAGISYAFLLG